MQKILECPDHTARLLLVRSFVEAETKRLTTKKTITGMFSGEAKVDESLFPPEEQISDDDNFSKDGVLYNKFAASAMAHQFIRTVS